MQIERVNIEDVYPVEDEYGNQYLSRDYSLKENQRYVEELAASFGESGEPDEPPVLVRDGGIYRIKAGNTRIEAMRKRGTKTFRAVIDERDTPQSLVEAAVRTDTKKAYEPVERSRFEQQLYLFGDDAYVSEVAGRDVEDVRKVRSTIERAGDACEDMTVERMIAMAEFEDDPDVYDALACAKESEWRRLADDARREKAQHLRRVRLAAELVDREIEAVDGVPEGYEYRIATNSADGIPKELPEGSVCMRYRTGGDGLADEVSIYVPASDATDPEEEAEKGEEAIRKAALARVRKHRLEWFLEHWDEEMPALCDLDDDPVSAFGSNVVSFCAAYELELPWSPAATIEVFVAFDRCSPYEEDTIWHDPAQFMEFVDALERCGYEPDAEERGMYEECKKAIKEEESE